MLVCASITAGCQASFAQETLVLTGRFAARVDGPQLTSFGPNRESYIFQITSDPGIHFAILRYTFLIYEPQLPRRVFDFFRLYSFNAVKDDKCAQSLGDASKRFIFDEYGRFLGAKHELDYSKNAPSLAFLYKTRLSCYVLTSESVRTIQ